MSSKYSTSTIDYNEVDSWILPKIETPIPTHVDRLLHMYEVKQLLIKVKPDVTKLDERLKLNYGTWLYLNGYLSYWSIFETKNLNSSFGIVTAVTNSYIQVDNRYNLSDSDINKLTNTVYFINERKDSESNRFISQRVPFKLKEYNKSTKRLTVELYHKLDPNNNQFTKFIKVGDRIMEAGTFITPESNNMSDTINSSVSRNELLNQIQNMRNVIKNLELELDPSLDGNPDTEEPTKSNELIIARSWLLVYNLQLQLFDELNKDQVDENKVAQLKYKISNALEKTRRKSSTEDIITNILNKFIIYKLGTIHVGSTTHSVNEDQSLNKSTNVLTQPINCSVYSNDQFIKNTFICKIAEDTTELSFVFCLDTLYNFNIERLIKYDFYISFSLSKWYTRKYFTYGWDQPQQQLINWVRLSNDKNNINYYRYKITINLTGNLTNVTSFLYRDLELSFSFFITARQHTR